MSSVGMEPSAQWRKPRRDKAACPARTMLKETAMHEGSITIRFPVEFDQIERLNRLVRQFGELHEVPSRTLYAVNLAMDELVTNAILYGFEDPKGQELCVSVSVAGSELRGELVDEGREFNPLEYPTPKLDAPLSDRELGGLGLHLVRSLMDRMLYRREGSKNVLTLMKRVR
jgi:serine/threonine-protein kinase RsbW